jgi:Tfp pilus assembly protein PilN
MINLLPNETKKQLRAARTNTILTRYIITIFFAAAFLCLVILGSYYIMSESKKTAENAITGVKTGNSSYSPTTKKSSAFISDLSTAKSILDKRVSYSKILENLINALPTGVILESPLSINRDALNLPITLKAYAKSSSSEATLKANLQSNPTFLNYSLASVTSNTGVNSEYPYLITFSLTINGAVR